ncbi:TPA: hypothetical protein N0F65_006311 [Lagenidium giganteum]|uniref:Uncharacterized protein n=1 Tax=Lagenidium giganteum TaxID=4803 RepID=A0AAV2YPL6_9STRA|nr:TPA: hypothetical protein N0F65_006311 [Lagenidium giganteum]
MARATAAPWNLFANAARPQVIPQAPLYLNSFRESFEFSLESMRLAEEPIGMQLLNRNARRPKKVSHRCCCCDRWPCTSH